MRQFRNARISHRFYLLRSDLGLTKKQIYTRLCPLGQFFLKTCPTERNRGEQNCPTGRNRDEQNCPTAHNSTQK